ncbi:MAG: sulfotransferase domain-containing protein [Deltaproteobacteria bacterium]|nr:sulfotransferase domain-containing protein [Deltaproteobacteria bacterium]
MLKTKAFRFRQRVTFYFNKAGFSGYQPPLRLLSSQPRSGTHWLKFMISYVLGQPPLERRFLESSILVDTLDHETSGCLIYDHFEYELHSSTLTLEKYPNLRMVLLFRNPLDVLVSIYHFRGYYKNDTAALGVTGYDLDSPETKKMFLRERSKTIRSYVRKWVIDWLKTGYCFPVKYEDLVADPEQQLIRILNHLCIAYTPEIVAEAVKHNSFETLSGGRFRGVADPYSHYRRGVHGEWREFFDQEDLEIIRSQIDDYLEFLGYSLD